MITVTMPQAQEQLPNLLLTAAAGNDEIEIVADSGRTFLLTVQTLPLRASATSPGWLGYPHPGSAKGLIEAGADFDAPIDELKEYME